MDLLAAYAPAPMAPAPVAAPAAAAALVPVCPPPGATVSPFFVEKDSFRGAVGFCSRLRV